MASIWRVLCPVFVVLVSGFVAGGCSKEEKTKDVFNPPEPKVVRSAGTLPLRVWDQASNRALDIHDTVDFRNTGATGATITTSCYFINQFHTTNLLEVKNPETVRVFQILPQEILSADFGVNMPTCSFIISLRNSAGSTHIFPTTAAPVTDLGEGEVETTKEGVVRYNQVTNGEVGGICNDITTPRIPFRSVSEKKYIDFSSAILRDKRFENTLLLRPKQTCRIGVFEDGRLVSISSKFEVLVNWAPMPSTIEFHAKGDVDPADSSTYDHFSFFTLKTDKELMRIAYSNPNSAPRMVLIPKYRLPAIYEMFSISGNRGSAEPYGYKHPVPRDWIYLIPQPRGNTKISDSNNNWLITMEGKDDSFSISMYASGAPGSRCVPNNFSPTAVLLYPASPIFITEVMEGELKIQDVQVELSDKVMIGFGPNIRRQQIESFEHASTTVCNWPL